MLVLLEMHDKGYMIDTVKCSYGILANDMQLLHLKKCIYPPPYDAMTFKPILD